MRVQAPDEAKIFIRNATILDCAVLFPEVGPRGRSWHVDLLWIGETDETGVVFDFSLAKKAAKETIDRHFDHRLMVPESSIRQMPEGRTLVCSPFRTPAINSCFALNTYDQALAVVGDNVIREMTEGLSVRQLEALLASYILASSPQNVKNVIVTLRSHEEEKKNHYFSYAHSLRKHFGNCQRFHGHSNVIEIFSEGHLDLQKSEAAAKFLDAGYLVTQDYLANDSKDPLFDSLLTSFPELSAAQNELTHVIYDGTQGKVAVMIPKSAVHLLQSESTIENIAEYVHRTFELDKTVQVVAYEGLAKGSIFP